MLRLTVTPTHDGLFTLQMAALDQQALATGSGFQLTDREVTLTNLGALAFNLPLFNPTGLSITKSADLQQVEIGDVLSYRVTVSNPTAVALGQLTLEDLLPPSFHYATGTAFLQTNGTLGAAVEPLVQGNKLVFALGQLAAQGTVQVVYRVRLGVNAQAGEQRNLARASASFPDGTAVNTPTVFAAVTVGPGAFGTRQIVLGRVFVDRNQNQRFDAGDQPVPGAQLFLDNGQAVITDAQGQDNFPAVEGGTLVIVLDQASLPKGLQLAASDVKQERSWTRMFRSPLGGGIVRENFALTGTLPEAATKAAAQAATKLTPPTDQPPPQAVVNAVPAAPAAPAAPPHETAKPPVCEASKVRDNSTANNTTVCTKLATETITPVPPGAVVLVSPQENSVAAASTTELTVRVALEWKARVEIEGVVIPDTSIGQQAVDRKNQVTTLTYSGFGLSVQDG